MADSHATEPGADGAAPEAAKPASKKKLIIIIVIVLVVIGGAVGGLLASGLLSKKPAADAEHGEAAEEEGGHGEGGKSSHSKSPAGNTASEFYEMPNMIVNLSGDNGKQRFLKISITLELNSKADIKTIEAVLPRVTDHFQTYLRELRLDDLRGSAGLYRLRQELLDRVHSASGVDVKDVLFEEILVQ